MQEQLSLHTASRAPHPEAADLPVLVLPEVVDHLHVAAGQLVRRGLQGRAGAALQLEALDLLLQGPLAVLQLLQLAVLVALAEPQGQELLLQRAAFGSAVPEPLLQSTGGMSTWSSSGEEQHHTHSRQQLLRAPRNL